MVFKSHNKIRKCKYCDNPPKMNMSGGRNHGYYRTCGSEKCLNAQYADNYVCILKGKHPKPVDYVCGCCGLKYTTTNKSNKRYCSECVPDKSWRGRAGRYRIGKKQWDIMMEQQKETCALCSRNPEVVDHCHKTGRIRGLLCNICNTSIAALDRDKSWLDKAFEYIGGT